MLEINTKLEEYKSLMKFEDEIYGKDHKANYKFVNWAVKRMIKKKESVIEILSFLEDSIRIQKVLNDYLFN